MCVIPCSRSMRVGRFKQQKKPGGRCSRAKQNRYNRFNTEGVADVINKRTSKRLSVEALSLAAFGLLRSSKWEKLEACFFFLTKRSVIYKIV